MKDVVLFYAQLWYNVSGVSVNIKMHIFYQIIMYSFHQEDSSVAAYIWARRKDFPFIGTTVA